MRFYQEIQAACSTFQGKCKFVFRPYSFGRYVRLKNIRIAKSMSAYFITKIYPKRVLHAKFKGIFPCGKCRSGKTYPRRCAICRIGRARRKGQYAVFDFSRCIGNCAKIACRHALDSINAIRVKRQGVKRNCNRRLIFCVIPNGFRRDLLFVDRPCFSSVKCRKRTDCATRGNRYGLFHGKVLYVIHAAAIWNTYRLEKQHNVVAGRIFNGIIVAILYPFVRCCNPIVDEFIMRQVLPKVHFYTITL